jgi:hypothetical protein
MLKEFGKNKVTTAELRKLQRWRGGLQYSFRIATAYREGFLVVCSFKYIPEFLFLITLHMMTI